MADIRVPKLNNNDTGYQLVAWLVDEDEPVKPDQPVAEVETSKAVEELVSGAEGVLRRLLAVGDACAPGEVIARVVEPGAPREEPPARPNAVTEAAAEDPGPVVTAPARELMDQLGIDPARLRELDVKIVKRADVERLAPEQDSADTRQLPVPQQAVARTVSRSHAEIPAAYTVIAVDAGPAKAEVARQTTALGRLLGLPELLIAAVARLHAAHPLCFARLTGEHTVRIEERPHIGVTIDVGKGLNVPVVKDADQLSFAELVEVTTAFRRTAVRGRFRESELSGATIGVTLHNAPDIVHAIPMIFPGQTCALALSGVRPEVVPDGDGFRARDTVNLGLAYDHRVVNGKDAVDFLQDLKAALEHPEELTR
ncbi:2-oxo acid dehydrogenase subunit E2 [Streptantibioticus cattleyicolor]|uniref:Dihydrolipoamide acetyltransferase component of pyruvate dehydrogenase complex n=1 Tax=Streptantibioticus cattleyicolor (strain ATCC 35852 / DSM 46488 / JCM 4925 / NBRC 14057 / NRRL 8057) TaxID=1003195 RepID=F8JKR6_STREN|nr:2-oxo acid dehydrogenase subunit E2 [Streptantibioticus cattleyicolor]AEW98441.1 catalytic domain of components of various dehydrogenase complexes [Streptantibioticus cattleyicolor NRRL 8057 = DSM 46488]CCB72504.1 Pyruvate/2-oxoglutarate dehydrogenase complex, dihydrolipoamide acyltransferase component [Streptantibioticus cattleyicolor NRRL 8057 = DSM 46488]